MNTAKRFSIWLTRTSNGWVVLGVSSILVVFMLFTFFTQPLANDSPVGAVGIPDLLFFYTPQTLYQMAEAYGAVGRAAYIRGHFTLDIIWPLIYTVSLVVGISWTFRRITPPESRWRWGNLIPIIGIGFDMMENLLTSWVMYRYPLPANFAAYAATLFTMLKWIFVLISLALLTVGTAGALWQAVGKPGQKR